jgi:ABC-type hemin transport system ATPase subunit
LRSVPAARVLVVLHDVDLAVHHCDRIAPR